MSQCSIKGCKKEAHARGWCHMHYSRWWSYGDVTYTQKKHYHMSQTPIYHAWRGMIRRCHYSKHPQYKDYGARGITVCNEWREDFGEFYAYIGDKPSAQHSLDRKDNNGNYEPGNVRWATKVQQQNNRRTTTYVTIRGQTKSLAEWSRVVGITPEGFYGRVKAGWGNGKLLSPSQRHKLDS